MDMRQLEHAQMTLKWLVEQTMENNFMQRNNADDFKGAGTLGLSVQQINVNATVKYILWREKHADSCELFLFIIAIIL